MKVGERMDLVSIHAPARGATNVVEELYRGQEGFNPRPRTGGDAFKAKVFTNPERFNPRPRTGGDSFRRKAER